MFLLALAAPAWAEYDGDLMHCADAAIDEESWLRVTCPAELAAYEVVTIYVWFGQEIPPLSAPVLEIKGAAYPLICNQIRGEAFGAKRVYAKYRCFNPVAFEQYVTLHWLIRP
jgi:hypothetical protein